MNTKIKNYYHKKTFTWTHLVICEATKIAVLIDPVLDYNAYSANTSTESTDLILKYIVKHNIQLKYIIETHAHADHITSAKYIQSQLNSKIVIGEGILSVQETFKPIFNLTDFRSDGSQFCQLLKNKDTLSFGDCQLLALYTPGHTNDSMSFIIDDCIFIGDTLFSPNFGSARCDFPGGDAGKLYESVHKIYQLGEDKKLYLCHDYPKKDRKPQAWFLSKTQQQNNKHLNLKITKDEFIQLRTNRDKQLNQPKLIIPSIQINIAAGEFPEPENNGTIYLKTPLNSLKKTI